MTMIPTCPTCRKPMVLLLTSYACRDVHGDGPKPGGRRVMVKDHGGSYWANATDVTASRRAFIPPALVERFDATQATDWRTRLGGPGTVVAEFTDPLKNGQFVVIDMDDGQVVMQRQPGAYSTLQEIK